MRRKLSLTLVCAALLSMPANDATPFSYTFSVSVYAMRRKTFRPTLSSCLKKRSRGPKTITAMCRHACKISLFRTHIFTGAKKHMAYREKYKAHILK